MKTVFQMALVSLMFQGVALGQMRGMMPGGGHLIAGNDLTTAITLLNRVTQRMQMRGERGALRTLTRVQAILANYRQGLKIQQAQMSVNQAKGVVGDRYMRPRRKTRLISSHASSAVYAIKTSRAYLRETGQLGGQALRQAKQLLVEAAGLRRMGAIRNIQMAKRVIMQHGYDYDVEQAKVLMDRALMVFQNAYLDRIKKHRRIQNILSRAVEHLRSAMLRQKQHGIDIPVYNPHRSGRRYGTGAVRSPGRRVIRPVPRGGRRGGRY